MSLIDEKRKGAERRFRNDGPPRGREERRMKTERRQTEMAEISFIEWATHFAKYQGKAVAEAEATIAARASDVLARARS